MDLAVYLFIYIINYFISLWEHFINICSYSNVYIRPFWHIAPPLTWLHQWRQIMRVVFVCIKDTSHRRWHILRQLRKKFCTFLMQTWAFEKNMTSSFNIMFVTKFTGFLFIAFSFVPLGCVPNNDDITVLIFAVKCGNVSAYVHHVCKRMSSTVW